MQPLMYGAYYGSPAADDPFASSDLMIRTLVLPDGPQWDDAGPADFDEDEGVPVMVRGHEGRGCPRAGSPTTGLSMATLSWSETASLDVSLVSGSLDLDQLVTVAEALTVDGDSVTLEAVPDGIPGPLDRVAELTTRRHGLTSSNGPGASVDESDTDLVTRVWGWTATRRPIGSSEPSTPSPTRVTRMFWNDSPGVVVDVPEGGTVVLSELEMLTIAESQREVSDEEWEAALRRSEQQDGQIDVAVVASHVPSDALVSVTTDGMGAAAYLRRDGQVCAFMVDGEGRLPDTCGDAAERVHVLRNRHGELWVLFGPLPPGAQEVAASHIDVAEPMYGFLDRPPDEGPTIYAVVPPGFIPDTLTFRANGVAVETLRLDLG